MDPLDPVEVEPTDPRVLPLIERHLSFARATSPACSVHSMEADELADAGSHFFAVFDGEHAVAMGALKRIDATHGEVKSMHVHPDHRGAGLADRVLDAVLDKARALRCTRVSLETGSQKAFAAARFFYARHGFSTCPPFDGYVEDVHSVFMTKSL